MHDYIFYNTTINKIHHIKDTKPNIWFSIYSTFDMYNVRMVHIVTQT